MSWKNSLVSLIGSVVLSASCATINLNTNPITITKNMHEAKLTRFDRNKDGKHDAGLIELKNLVTGEKQNELYLDTDFDGNLDTVYIDNGDKEGNLGKPDGVYDRMMGFDLRYFLATGQPPIEEEYKVDVFLKRFLKMNWSD